MLSICPASTQAPVRVLLVEDDAEISRMLTEILAENGIVACSVISATEMDQRLAQDDVDLIVLDVMLPGEDGFSICRRLRAGSSLPIIMLTALGEDVDRILGLEIGADDYVSKPFNSRELIARIRALLRRAGSRGVPTRNASDLAHHY
jgi:two-component system, OmpR family, response regulator